MERVVKTLSRALLVRLAVLFRSSEALGWLFSLPSSSSSEASCSSWVEARSMSSTSSPELEAADFALICLRSLPAGSPSLVESWSVCVRKTIIETSEQQQPLRKRR